MNDFFYPWEACKTREEEEEKKENERIIRLLNKAKYKKQLIKCCYSCEHCDDDYGRPYCKIIDEKDEFFDVNWSGICDKYKMANWHYKGVYDKK